MKKLIIGLLTGMFLGGASYTFAATVLFPYQGGTGISAPASGDVGKCLTLGSWTSASNWAYSFATCGTGGGGSGDSVLSRVGNKIFAPTTTDQILFGASSTSTNSKLEIFRTIGNLYAAVFHGDTQVDGTLTVNSVTATSTTATSTFPQMYSSTSTISNLNGVVVLDGIRYDKTDTGIRQAISQLGSASGTIYIRNGGVTLTSPINLTNKSNIRFECESQNVVFRIPEANLPSFSFSYMFYSGSDITFNNCTFDGQYSTYAAPGANQGGGIAPGTRWTVTNNVFKDFNYFGVWLGTEAVDSKLWSNRFIGPGRGNDHIGGGGSIGSDVGWNIFESNIAGNMLDNTGGQFLSVHDNINYSDKSIYIEAMNNVKVERNKMYGGGDITVKSDSGYVRAALTNSKDVDINHNEVIGGSIILSLYASTSPLVGNGGNYSIVNNRVSSSTYSGILVHASSGDIVGWGVGIDVSHNAIFNPNTSFTSTWNTGFGINHPSCINVMEGIGVRLIGNTCVNDALGGAHYGIELGQTFSPSSQSEPNDAYLFGNFATGTASGTTNIVSSTYTNRYSLFDNDDSYLTGTINVKNLGTSTIDGTLSSGVGSVYISPLSSSFNTLINRYGGRLGVGSSSPDSMFSLPASILDGTAKYLAHIGDDVTNTSITKLLVENRWTGQGGIGFIVRRSASINQFMVDGDGTVNVGATTSSAVSGRLTVRSGGSTSGRTLLLTNSNNTENLVALDSGELGIGTSTPYSKLSVAGQVVGQNFIATSTTASSTFFGLFSVQNNATSTFLGGINLETGCFSVKGACITGGGSYTDAQARAAVIGLFAATTSSNIWTNSQTFNNYNATNGSTTNATSTNLEVTSQASTTQITVSKTLGVGTSSSFVTSLNHKIITDFGVIPGGTVAGNIAFSDVGGNVGYAREIIRLNSSSGRVGGYFGAARSPSTNFLGIEIGTEANTNADLRFNTNGFADADEKMRLTKAGNLGIGTTTPYAKLSVTGQIVGEYFSSTSTTASSTFANGINLTGGCFAVNNNCIGGATGSSFAYLFPNDATSTLLNFVGGLISLASSTVQTLNSTSFTATNATTTTFEATQQASTTQLTVSRNARVGGTFGVGTSSPNSGAAFNTYSGIAVAHIGDDVTNDSRIRLLVENRWTDNSSAALLVRRNTVNPYFFVGGGGTSAFGTTSPFARLTVWGQGSTASTQNFELVNNASTTLMRVLNDGSAYLLGNVGIATTSPSATLGIIGNLLVNNTATSTFMGSLNVQNRLQIGTSSIYLNGSGTSTFSHGISLASGCISVNGTCISPGSASAAGSNGQIQFNNGGALGASANMSFDQTAGGELRLEASAAVGAGNGGRLFLIGGAADTVGNGGQVRLDGADGGSVSGDGGGFLLVGGAAVNGNGGNVSLSPGNSIAGGVDGTVQITDPSTSNAVSFDTSTLTDNRSFIFPDLAGTFALTRQLVSTSTADTWTASQFFNASTTLASLDTSSSTLGVFLATRGTTTALAITNLNAASCDVKAQTNGSLYCGTDASGGGSSNVATSTFAWTIFKQGNNVVVWDNDRGEAVSTQTTLNDAFSKYIIQNATSTARGKWSVYITEGYYPVNSTTTLTGEGKILGASEWVIRGSGASTTLLMNANTVAFNPIDQAKITLSDMSVAFSSAAPQSTAIFASSTAGTVQSSMRESTIERIMFYSTTTGHTAYPIIDRSGFRNHFSDLDFFQTGGCFRTENWYTNAQFISGDSFYTRMFCEVNMSGVSAYKFEGVRGLINQNTLVDLDGIANHTNNTMFDFIGVSRTTVDQFNSEEFATTTSVRSTSATVRGETNTFRTNKYINMAPVANTVVFYTDANALNNAFIAREVESSNSTYLFIDRNTLSAVRSNRFGEVGGNVTSIFDAGTASWLFATTTTSVVGTIFERDANNFNYLNRMRLAGDKIIFDLNSGADTVIQWLTTKLAFIFDGVEEAFLNGSGLTVADTVTATRFVATSTAATSTFKGVTADCFSTDGVTCIGAAGGSYSGTGGAGQITYWTGATAFTGASDFVWDNTLKHLGIGSSTPWAGLSLVDADENTPAFVIASSTDYSSIGFISRWTTRLGLFGGANKAGYETHIGGSTSTQRFALNGTTIFGRMNSDTLMVNIDPLTAPVSSAALTADSASLAPGAVFDEMTDASLGVATMASTSDHFGVGNGCNDGGAWFYIRPNELLGAVANDGGWVRGSGVFNTRANTAATPPAIAGGTLTSTGTPVMEVTICTPHVMSSIAGSSTAIMPTLYGFGFGDTAIGTAFMSSTLNAPANGSFIAASTTDNWWLYSTDANVGVRTDTGVSTSSTKTAPQTFRIAMTATATYAYLFDYSTGQWNSIGVHTTRQTKRDFSWFLGVQRPGATTGRIDFLFRNLRVWYSPTYRF